MLGQGGISPVPGSAQGTLPQWSGIYYGVVSNNADPKKQNRCLLRVPQLLGSASTTWAVSLTPLQNPPAVGTLIAAMFIGGDIDYPCYLVVDPKISVEGTAGNIQPVGTTAAAGTSKNLAAADHVHTLANALTSVATDSKALGTQAAGASAKAARADHVHPNAVSELDGVTGDLILSSSTTGVGDTAAQVELISKNLGGQAQVNLNATSVSVNGTTLNVGNGTTSNIILNPQMVPPSTWPLTNDTNTGSSWATGERQFINDLNTAVNGIINSLRVHGLMS